MPGRLMLWARNPATATIASIRTKYASSSSSTFFTGCVAPKRLSPKRMSEHKNGDLNELHHESGHREAALINRNTDGKHDQRKRVREYRCAERDCDRLEPSSAKPNYDWSCEQHIPRRAVTLIRSPQRADSRTRAQRPCPTCGVEFLPRPTYVAFSPPSLLRTDPNRRFIGPSCDTQGTYLSRFSRVQSE